MRIGSTVFSANKDVDLAVKAKAPAPETLMNRRRVEFMSRATFLSFQTKSRNLSMLVPHPFSGLENVSANDRTCVPLIITINSQTTRSCRRKKSDFFQKNGLQRQQSCSIDRASYAKNRSPRPPFHRDFP